MSEYSRHAIQSIACSSRERERVHSRLALRSLIGDLHKREVSSLSAWANIQAARPSAMVAGEALRLGRLCIFPTGTARALTSE